jgi:hypothetical protein
MTDPDPASARKDRIAGYVLLGIAILFGYVGIGRPLRAAERGEAVELYLEACILVPFALVYGAGYAFFRDGTTRLLGTRHKPTTLGWIVLAVLIAAGLSIYVWMRLDLSRRGYRFDGF